MKKIILRVLGFIGVTLLMLVLCLYCVMWVVTKGPSEQARNLFVLSVRETSMAGFLANIYCSKAEIAAIEEGNKVKYLNEAVDTSLIKIDRDAAGDRKDFSISDEDKEDGVVYADGMEFHPVKGATYSGTMIVINVPSRVFVGTSSDKYDGSAGLSVPEICERYGATAASNAGGFEDIGGVGNGGTPLGIVISEGELKYGDLNTSYEIIGFDENDIFIIGNMTGQQALDSGVRDAVSWGPLLIVNGVPANVTGTGGGVNPRTAIGQREDGAVLLLIIDGRQTHSLGATLNDLINVFLDFDAVNAANLDGGGSTVFYYGGEIYNKISSIYGARGIPTAIVIR